MKNAGFREPELELEWARRCQGEVAFLRHKVPGIIHDEASDWDLAVRDLEQVRSVTRELLGEPWVLVPRTFVEQRYFAWGQIDFLPRFEWNGICYLNEDRFWKGVSVCEDGLPRPRVAHDAFIVWMTGLLWGGLYRTKYDEFLQRALVEDGREFEGCLTDAFGVGLGREMLALVQARTPWKARSLVSELRQALRNRAFYQRPTETLETVVRHWVCEFRMHWNPPYPWIAILGPEGSGKATLIKAIGEKLAQSRLKILTFRWCPGGSESDGPDDTIETTPETERSRGFFGSTFRLGALWLKWLRERWGPTWHRRCKERMLVSNRHYLDLLINPERYRYGGSLRLARWLFQLLPTPDLTIVLGGDAETLRDLVAGDHRIPGETDHRVVAIDATRDHGTVLREAFHLMRLCVFDESPDEVAASWEQNGAERFS